MTVMMEQFPVGMLQCNCTILGDEATREALVIDPGDEAERIASVLNRHHLTLKYIAHTHAHIDHIGGTGRLKELFGGEILVHPGDTYLYENVAMQAGWLGMPPPPLKPVDHDLADKDFLRWGSLAIEVIHTPGHTPGSVTFHLEGGTPILFTGDTLFLGSIGRTDLWGGSFETIMESIRERLLPFPDETVVYPGHGPATTIGAERAANPFITGKSEFFL